MELAVADVDEGRNGSAQVEQRVQLDRRLGRAKRRPRKQRQAQIDGGGVQRIDGLGQIHLQRFVGIEPAGDADQRLRELVVDVPVARFVGVGQCAAADVAPHAQVVELGGLRAQARLDVAQALPVGQLREGHAQELVQAAEAAHIEVAAILRPPSDERYATAQTPSPARTRACLRASKPPGKTRKDCNIDASEFKSLTPCQVMKAPPNLAV